MRVLALCEGGGSIGVGHVMRSLALAEAAVAAGHDVVVAGRFEGAFLARQLAAAPVEVAQLLLPMAQTELQDLIDLVRRLHPDLLHVDSYQAPDRLRELLAVADAESVAGSMRAGDKVSAPILSSMEDGTFGRRAADVVVDPTLGADLWARPDDGSTWLLRGSRYTPVRQAVVVARPRHDGDIPDTSVSVPDGEVARRVLVVMGGTDPVGLTPVAVDLLARTGLALDVTVIAVGEHADRARAAARSSRLSLSVLAPVDDLPALMADQDLVISAAGTSVWEVCCIGVPLAVIWAVDNQREGYERVVGAGAAVGLGGPELGGPELGGPELGGPPMVGEREGELARVAVERALALLTKALTDQQLRTDLVRTGRQVVDGLGAWRVVRTWEMAQRHARGPGRSERGGASEEETSEGDVLDAESPRADSRQAQVSHRLVARPATPRDARLLWVWRNDPATRAGSRSSKEVPWEDHLRWVTACLRRPDRRLLVVEGPVGAGGSVEAVGTVRWDLAGGREGTGEWEVSITVAPDRRGQSLARGVLAAAEVALTEMAECDVARPSGTEVTAYLAVVHVDNRASLRLFETSAYLPDLPPDPRGFMRFRKAARVA